jgi:hypothetical protein
MMVKINNSLQKPNKSSLAIYFVASVLLLLKNHQNTVRNANGVFKYLIIIVYGLITASVV